ncbi:MAG: alanine--tRNA ligase-related protein [Candidatus Omnitrophica bacterium]|nr:alanine--tRNA ligase-related protein [Candidatus Omnitrophota bacterium]
MQADILREKFLNFFKSKKHKIVESDSLLPKDDPTVLFTPAGMNQFKKEFLGFDSGFKRAATAQRCLRTDDLEKVGKTSAHTIRFLRCWEISPLVIILRKKQSAGPGNF